MTQRIYNGVDVITPTLQRRYYPHMHELSSAAAGNRGCAARQLVMYHKTRHINEFARDSCDAARAPLRTNRGCLGVKRFWPLLSEHVGTLLTTVVLHSTEKTGFREAVHLLFASAVTHVQRLFPLNSQSSRSGNGMRMST